MEADGTDGGCLGAHDDMTAVAALPDVDTTLAEHFHRLDVVQQGTVAFLVVLLDGRYATELSASSWKPSSSASRAKRSYMSVHS